MSALPRGRTDDPVQSHDQILQANTGKSADASLLGALVPNAPLHLSRHATFQSLVICSKFKRTRQIIMSWQAQLNHARPPTPASLTRANDDGTNQPRIVLLAGISERKLVITNISFIPCTNFIAC